MRVLVTAPCVRSLMSFHRRVMPASSPWGTHAVGEVPLEVGHAAVDEQVVERFVL